MEEEERKETTWKEVTFSDVIRSKSDLMGWKLVLRKDDMVIRDVPLRERFFAILSDSIQSSSTKKPYPVELQGKELKVVLDELLEDAEHALLESELLKECLSPRSKVLRKEKRKFKRESTFRTSEDGTLSPLSPLSEGDYGDSPIPDDMFDDLDSTLGFFQSLECGDTNNTVITPSTNKKIQQPQFVTPKLVTPKRSLNFDITTGGIGGYVLSYRKKIMSASPSKSTLFMSSNNKRNEDFLKEYMTPILPKGLESVISNALLSTRASSVILDDNDVDDFKESKGEVVT